MPISPELLKILVCPETRQPVRPAEPSVIAEVNERIGAGTLRTRSGELVERPVEEALVREDGACLYVIRDGIPCMLVDERIDLVEGDDEAAA